jgi:hypothetical protein
MGPREARPDDRLRASRTMRPGLWPASFETPAQRAQDGGLKVMTQQDESLMRSGSVDRLTTPAVAGYFAWGCFRYFVWAVNEASGRT